MAIVAVVAALAVSAVSMARAAAAKAACGNHLRQLALALHQHHAEHHAYPAGSRSAKLQPKMPYLAWSAQMLPYLEQGSLWNQAQAAFAEEQLFWRPAHNPIRSKVLPIFTCPADDRTRKPSPWGNKETGLLSYLGVAGVTSLREDGILFRDSRIRNAEISDGLSSTLMIGERPPCDNLRFGWWYAGLGQRRDGAGDCILGVRDACWRYDYCTECERQAYHFAADRVDNRCAFLHFWSLHAGGGHFAFADGSVRFLRYAADPLLPAMATRAGRESVAE